SESGTSEFFLDVARVEARRGGAFVVALELDSAPIAAILVFQRGATAFVAKVAYDATWGKMSPGWLLMMKFFMECCDAKMRAVDLMIGADAWKERFGGRPVPVANYRLRTLQLVG